MVVYRLEEGYNHTEKPLIQVQVCEYFNKTTKTGCQLQYWDMANKCCAKRIKACTHLAHQGSCQKGLNLKSRDENINLSAFTSGGVL